MVLVIELMMPGVICLGQEHYQVMWVVVVLDPVLMMDHFSRIQRPPEDSLGCHTVNVFSGFFQVSIWMGSESMELGTAYFPTTATTGSLYFNVMVSSGQGRHSAFLGAEPLPRISGERPSAPVTLERYMITVGGAVFAVPPLARWQFEFRPASGACLNHAGTRPAWPLDFWWEPIPAAVLVVSHSAQRKRPELTLTGVSSGMNSHFPIQFTRLMVPVVLPRWPVIIWWRYMESVPTYPHSAHCSPLI